MTKSQIAALVFIGLGTWQWYTKSKESPLKSYNASQIEQIAQSAHETDVAIYTTSGCPYSAKAKTWMDDHDIPYRECNLTTDQTCVREFEEFGGDGVPWLVVKGSHMREGFSPEELLNKLDK